MSSHSDIHSPSPSSLGIISPRDTVRMQGTDYTLPTERDIQAAERLTAQQNRLFNRFAQLGSSEQAEGMKLSIQRKVAELETRKHPLLKVWNIHLLPAGLRRRAAGGIML